MNNLQRVEIQRDRWRRARQPFGLTDPISGDFATGGLARFVSDVGVRMVILPPDPEDLKVEFDQALWEWWMRDRANPFEGAARTQWGIQKTPTEHAAVRYDQGADRRWDWRRYVALHRHGGLEFGLGGDGVRSWRRHQDQPERRVFFLATIVGRVWTALSLYVEVIDRLAIDGPWEVSVALTNTEGAGLGNVAAGWADYDSWEWWDLPCCPEPNLLLRTEIQSWPELDGIRELAFDFGGWIEDSWGFTDRRFLAGAGDAAGQYDTSRYRVG